MGESDSTNFAFKLTGANLPMYSNKDNQILNMEILDQFATNIQDGCLDFIKDENSQIQGRKEIPTKHFAVDFSHIIINRKLE